MLASSGILVRLGHRQAYGDQGVPLVKLDLVQHDATQFDCEPSAKRLASSPVLPFVDLAGGELDLERTREPPRDGELYTVPTQIPVGPYPRIARTLGQPTRVCFEA